MVILSSFGAGLGQFKRRTRSINWSPLNLKWLREGHLEPFILPVTRFNFTAHLDFIRWQAYLEICNCFNFHFTLWKRSPVHPCRNIETPYLQTNVWKCLDKQLIFNMIKGGRVVMVPVIWLHHRNAIHGKLLWQIMSSFLSNKPNGRYIKIHVIYISNLINSQQINIEYLLCSWVLEWKFFNFLLIDVKWKL